MSGPIVLGTAGHVDHGKSALVLALTGHDTDRLPEEKRRGISIALGFAPLDLPSGRRVSLVDVPGHERFVRHMVAGASGVDGYLLCVAADDGVMPQTREHLAVLRLLGVEDGVVAITKSDLVEPDLAAEEARELVGGGPEIVAVSAREGTGLTDLLAALERLVERVPRRTTGARPRLFVDRSFSVAGAGTVVTGTLWGDGIAVGEHVSVEPGGLRARVRGAQSHDLPVEIARGGRTAFNLAGVEREEVARGACVVRVADEWRPCDLLDVRIALAGDATPVRTRRRVQAFLGTAEVGAIVVLLDRDVLDPGESGLAQLRLDRQVPAELGDRLVLRSAERRTVGGAVVIDAAPARHGKGTRAAARLAAIEAGDHVAALRIAVRDAGPAGLAAAALPAADLDAVGAVVLPTGTAVFAADFEAARSRLLAAVGDGLSAGHAAAATGMAGDAAEGVVAGAVQAGLLVRDGGRLVPAGRPAESPDDEAVLAVLRAARLQPPALAELARTAGIAVEAVDAALGRLRASGRVVQGGDLWFDADAAGEARAAAADALAAGPMGIGALRDTWAVGRRHALALAAHLDASGLTRRQGEVRVLRRGAIREGSA